MPFARPMFAIDLVSALQSKPFSFKMLVDHGDVLADMRSVEPDGTVAWRFNAGQIIRSEAVLIHLDNQGGVSVGVSLQRYWLHGDVEVAAV